MYILAINCSTVSDHGLMCTWPSLSLQTLDECHVVSWSDKCTKSNMIAYVQDGVTALYIASWTGHGPIVKLLLQTEHTDISICTKVSPYILVL